MRISLTVAVVVFLALLVVAGLPSTGVGQEKQQAVETRVFDVRDLIISVPDYSGPAFELQNISGASHTYPWQGSSVFSDTADGGAVRGEAGATMEEGLMDLIDMIRQVVEPGTWDEGGGNAIRGRQGNLIVTHKPEVFYGSR